MGLLSELVTLSEANGFKSQAKSFGLDVKPQIAPVTKAEFKREMKALFSLQKRERNAYMKAGERDSASHKRWQALEQEYETKLKAVSKLFGNWLNPKTVDEEADLDEVWVEYSTKH